MVYESPNGGNRAVLLLCTLRLLLFVLFTLLVTPVTAWGQASPSGTQATVPKMVSFTFDELPAPSSENKKFTLTFDIESDGRYVATHQTLGDDGSALAERSANGQLTEEELKFIRGSLAAVDMVAMTGKTMNVGYGSKLEPGWRGALAVSDAGQSSAIEFTSLRPETYPERAANINKLVTLLFDLKNVSLHKIDAAHEQP